MKLTKAVIVSILMVYMLSACGSDSKSDANKDIEVPTPTVSDTTGIWHAKEYGLIFDINDTSHVLYQISESYCQIFDLNAFEAYTHQEMLSSITVSDDKHSMVTTVAGKKIPGMSTEKITELPESCTTGLTVQNGDESYSFNAQTELDIFWQTFDEFYAFFKIENVDWNEAYQIADCQIDVNSTELELFDVLAQMITPLRDFHVNLVNDELDLDYNVTRKAELSDIVLSEFIELNELTPPYTEQIIEDYETYYDRQLENSLSAIMIQMEEPKLLKSNDSKTIHWSITKDNLGYLLIETMDLPSLGDHNLSRSSNLALLDGTFDEIISDFEATGGVIIDVRYNEGGDDFVSQYIVSRFVDKELHAYSKQVKSGNTRTPIVEIRISPDENNFTAPIVVLTSNTTSSAAEIFTMSMKQREDTISIGESTGGGLSGMLPKTLPHGLFYSMSNEFYLTPDGISYEGTGVPVDIERAFFTFHQRENGLDDGLTVAREWLNEQLQ